MSYNPSQTTALPSGIYAIRSSDHEAVMAPKKPRNSGCTFVVAEADTPLFQVLPSFIFILVIIYSRRTIQWDVQYNQGGYYTIQIRNQSLYIATQDVRA